MASVVDLFVSRVSSVGAIGAALLTLAGLVLLRRRLQPPTVQRLRQPFEPRARWTMDENTHVFDVVIIGGGAAGLAVAAEAQHRGLSVVVLERNARCGDVWRGRYDRLHLHTPRSTSHLPFVPFPASFGAHPSKDEVAAYLDAYPSLLRLQVHFGVTVDKVHEPESTRCAIGPWNVLAHSDTVPSLRYLARVAVVVATGQNGKPRIPSWPGAAEFHGPIVHAGQYRNGSQYHGQAVLVVGAGNSGAEIAIDLVEHGAHSTLLIRSPIAVVPLAVSSVVQWLAPLLGGRGLSPEFHDQLSAPIRFVLNSLARHGVPLEQRRGPMVSLVRHHRPPLIDIGTIDLIRRQHIKVITGGIARFTRTGIVTENGSEVPFDACILATGYEQDSFSSFLPAHIVERLPRENGFINDPIVPNVPGLYFSGYRDMFGALAQMRHDAPLIANHIVGRVHGAGIRSFVV